MKQFLFGLLALSFFVASCTKKPTVTLTREDMLRIGKWRISSSKVTLKGPNGKVVTVDYGKYRKKCIVDNYLRFDSAYHGAVYNGGSSCSAADADSIGFIWELKENGTVLNLNNYYQMIDSIGQQIIYDATDNVWKLVYDTAITSRNSLVGATITDFSQASFTMNYHYPGVYLDTTGGNQGSPVRKPDTYYFQITYSNF